MCKLLGQSSVILHHMNHRRKGCASVLQGYPQSDVLESAFRNILWIRSCSRTLDLTLIWRHMLTTAILTEAKLRLVSTGEGDWRGNRSKFGAEKILAILLKGRTTVCPSVGLPGANLVIFDKFLSGEVLSLKLHEHCTSASFP